MKNYMKTATIIAAIAAATVTAQAELTNKEFEQMASWAEARGYFYEGIEQLGRFETKCFAFSNRHPGVDYLCAYVPVSSDTADEAINALIASAVTLDVAVASGREVVAKVRREAAPARIVQEPLRKTAGIPSDVLERIKAKAENDWADDYEMQNYVIKKQANAYLELNN
jgi:hypothetical protein